MSGKLKKSLVIANVILSFLFNYAVPRAAYSQDWSDGTADQTQPQTTADLQQAPQSAVDQKNDLHALNQQLFPLVLAADVEETAAPPSAPSFPVEVLLDDSTAQPADGYVPMNNLGANQSAPASTFAQPGYLQSVLDPIYGGSLTRITGNDGDSIGGTSAEWGLRNINRYSTDSSWNQDGKYMIVNVTESNTNSAKLLLDGETYQFKKVLSIPGVGFTNYRWSTNPNNPNTVYVFIENTNKIYVHNVETGSTRTIDLSFNLFHGGKETVAYGADGKEYMALLGRSSPSAGVFVYVVNLTDSAVAASLRLADHACTSTCDNGAGDYMGASPATGTVVDNQSIQMSDDGRYIRVAFKNRDNSGVYDQILKVDDNGSGGKTISVRISNLSYIGHATFVTNRSGHQVLVGMPGGNVKYLDLDSGGSSMATLNGATGVAHVSGTSNQLPGYVVATYNSSSIFKDEIVAFDVDNPGTVIRLVNHRSKNIGVYRNEPQVSLSPDGTKIVFQSNWGTTTSTAQISTFVVDIKLPGARPANFIPPTSAPVTTDPGHYTLQYTLDGQNYSVSGPQLQGMIKGPQAGRWSEGVNTIQFQRTVSGRVKTYTTEVQVDTTPPAIEIADAFYTNSITGSNLSIPYKADGRPKNLDVQKVQDLISSRGGSLAEGSNPVDLVFIDAAGNRTTVHAAIILDTVPPAVQVDPEHLTNSANSYQLHYQVDGKDFVLSGTALKNAVVSPTGKTFKEGLNQVEIKGKDAAGNVTTVRVNLTIDTKPPVITTTATTFMTNNPGGYELHYTLDGEDRVLAGADLSGAVTSNGGQIKEGTNTVKIQAVDAAGNTSSKNITLKVDTIPPNVLVQNNSSTVLLANDPAEFKARLTVDGSAKSYTASQLKSAIVGPHAGSWAEGINQVNLSFTDTAGNVTVQLLEFTLDTTPPQITLFNPVPIAISSLSAISFSFKVDAGTPNEKTVVLTGAANAAPYVKSPTQGKIKPGLNTMEYWYKDAAGNVSKITVTFTSTVQSGAYTFRPVPPPG